MEFAVPFALVGVLLIALRRPISGLILEGRKLFRPKLRDPKTRAGEVMIALIGCFGLVLSVIAVLYS